MKKLITLVLVVPAACLIALRAAAILTGVATIPSFFYGASPLAVVAVLAAGMASAAFVLGVVTDDYSWVDRLWSTAPVAFAWVYAVRGGLNPRVTVAALLITLWGARLTFNFARRGGYTSMEDYRWPILRERIGNPLFWVLFNFFFICSYQVGLFILFTLPVYALSLHPAVPLTTTFTGGALAFLLFLAYETVADQQQWDFQRAKYGVAGDPWPYGPDIQRGFRTTGLFRLSRHPNYFGELMVWWSIYYLAAVTGGRLLHWSAIGALLLTLLFIGSTWFTESITSRKYPDYAEYQRRTSAIVPWIPAPSPEVDVRIANGE